jgi:hypothetical protein
MQSSQPSRGFGRRLLNFVFSSALALLTVAGFWIGLAAAYAACQLQTLSGVAAVEPQPLTVADLLTKGPGKNLHVRLTDLTFGKPLIEEEDHHGKTVWVPVLPAGATGKPTERAVYLRAYVHDQSQLDQLLGRTSLDVVVASSLPELSQWRSAADEMAGLKKADVRVLAARVYLVRDADLSFGPLGTLPVSVALGGTAATVAWGVAGAGLSVGFFFLLLICTAKPLGGSGTPEPLGPGGEYEYGRLVNEIPQSEHVMPRGVLAKRILGRGVLAAVLLLLSLVFIGGIPSVLAGPTPAGVTGFLVLIVTFFLLAVLVVRRARGLSTRTVTAVSVCHSGLRLWSGDRVRLALWADIASVNSQEVEVVQRGQGGTRGGTTWMKLRNGESLTFRSGSISDWCVFARHVHGNVKGHNGQVASERMRGGFRSGSFLPQREHADD